jgi:DNA-binding CsgD family transcriptional regulator
MVKNKKESVEKIKDLYLHKKYTQKEIGQELNIDENRVKYLIHKYKIKKYLYLEYDQKIIDEVKKLYIDDNLPSSEIAKIKNLKKTQVNHLLKKFNIKKGRKIIDVDSVLSDLEDGVSLEEISQKLHSSIPTIKNAILRKYPDYLFSSNRTTPKRKSVSVDSSIWDCYNIEFQKRDMSKERIDKAIRDARNDKTYVSSKYTHIINAYFEANKS